jgi:hypothetical protein
MAVQGSETWNNVSGIVSSANATFYQQSVTAATTGEVVVSNIRLRLEHLLLKEGIPIGEMELYDTVALRNSFVETFNSKIFEFLTNAMLPLFLINFIIA